MFKLFHTRSLYKKLLHLVLQQGPQKRTVIPGRVIFFSFISLMIFFLLGGVFFQGEPKGEQVELRDQCEKCPLSEPVFYFAYGANLHGPTFKKRVGAVEQIGVGVLDHYVLSVSKLGRDGAGYLNIHATPEGAVHGYVFRLTGEQLSRLDEYEAGYHQATVTISLLERNYANRREPQHTGSCLRDATREHKIKGLPTTPLEQPGALGGSSTDQDVLIEAVTYIADPSYTKEGLHPTQKYMNRVLKGARSRGLPSQAITHIQELSLKRKR